MMSLRNAVSFLVLAACHARATPPAPEVARIAPDVAPPDAAAPSAQVSPASVTCTAKIPCSIVWTFGGHAHRATLKPAVKKDDDTSVDVEMPDGGATEHLDLGPDVRVTKLTVLDATADGQPDLIVWIDPATGPRYQAARSTYVFASGARIEQRTWAQAALGVLSSEAELRTAIAELRSFAAPTARNATEVVVLRLPYATTEQLRSLIGPGGLDVCDEFTGNALPHGKKCKHYTRAQVTGEVFASTGISRDRSIEGQNGDPVFYGLQPCSPIVAGSRQLCVQGTGGPANLELWFTGTGAQRRLREVTSSTYEST